MEKSIMDWKLGITAAKTACTAIGGWFGWLVLLWLGCFLLDFITG